MLIIIPAALTKDIIQKNTVKEPYENLNGTLENI
jgi:hypothetical protein